MNFPKHLLICALLSASAALLHGQTPADIPSAETDTLELIGSDSNESPVIDSLELDELNQLLHLKGQEAEGHEVVHTQADLDNRLVQWSLSFRDTAECNSTHVAPFSEEECKARLAAMPCVMPMTYNSLTRQYIESYLRHPKKVAMLKRLAEFYFPIFENVFGEADIPQELKYLAIIESGLVPNVTSRAGASGLWQFMPGTARGYGLEVTSTLDERLDTYQATRAAAVYLKRQYQKFGDWTLAIASYNCGSGNVAGAVKRNGGSKDYWACYPYLPGETRNYVPKFIAAAYVLTYACEYGICADALTDDGKYTMKEQLMPMLVDTIMTDRRQSLRQVAEVLSIPVEELRILNAQYRNDIVPGGKPYSIMLPIDMIGAYIDMQDSIVAYKPEQLLRPTPVKQEPSVSTAKNGGKNDGKGKTYTVVKGDTLGVIAKRQHCTVADLKKWNNLKSNNIRIGQTLRIRK